MATYKYVVNRDLYGKHIWTDKKVATVISAETTQKELIHLHQKGVKGISRIEIAQAKPKKKKRKNNS